MGDLLDDLRYALRGFLQSPVLTGAALLCLALGIGANTAIFSLTDQVLLRYLPVKDPGGLALLKSNGPKSGFMESNYDDEVVFSYPMYTDFRDRAPAVAGVLARFPTPLHLSAGEHTERVSGELVSGNYFEVLGAGTVLGRPLSPEDDVPGHANDVVVLSYDFWKHRFGGAASILDQTIHLNGRPMKVVGVARRGFAGVGASEAPAVFAPISLEPQLTQMPDLLRDRRGYWLNIFTRLKPGVTRQQAEAMLNVFWQPLLAEELRAMPKAGQQFRTRYLARHLSVAEGGRGISGVRNQASGPLLVLVCMVGVLLLITCANIANLLIARAAGRQKEIAIRLALGAGRMRMLRQLLTEGLTLSLAGGALGLLVASWCSDFLIGFVPSDPAVQGLTGHLDARVLLFGLALAVATGVIFGLAPALGMFQIDVAGSLKDQSSSVSSTSGRVHLRKLLVMAQIGMSLILLIGAGLFARSLFNLKDLDPGFRVDHMLSFAVQPSLNGYDQPRTRALYQRLRERIAARPQVSGVAMAEMALLAGSNDMSSFDIQGYEPREGENTSINENWVGPGFFQTMGIPLQAGRGFTEKDGAAGPRVAVINEVLANKYFQGQNPVGKRLRSGRREKKEDIEIVGVVRDGKHSDLREKSQAFVYMPYEQHESVSAMTFYARTTQDPAAMGTALRSEVREADPNLPVFEMKTVDRQIGESMFVDRLVATLASFFGVLATLLSAIGLYGVMAYTVSRRTREIGLRMALGAARGEVLRLILREAAGLALIGIVIALPAAWALSRLIQAQLYNVQGNDPWIFGAATVLLAMVAALAGLFPALRATNIDPMIALRNE